MPMRWLLPEYFEDILPEEAARIEGLRRTLLDLFAGRGYELVMPPLLEYVESLLTGTGHDLDLRTFKLVDQLSGRMMGVRADITPQVARIDAHLLNRKGVTRLCYCGSVLHARPAGVAATREPLQIGAEIYGHAGVASDLEVQRLLCRALGLARVRRPRLGIGHVAVFRALVRAARIGEALEAALRVGNGRVDVHVEKSGTDHVFHLPAMAHQHMTMKNVVCFRNGKSPGTVKHPDFKTWGRSSYPSPDSTYLNSLALSTRSV